MDSADSVRGEPRGLSQRRPGRSCCCRIPWASLIPSAGRLQGDAPPSLS